MFNTVLFAIDKSREAREAVDTVTDIVQKYGSRLVILSVVQASGEDQEKTEEIMASEEAVAKLLKGAQAVFAQKGIQSEVIERTGKPSFTICDVADEIEANLIVMGCRGMGLTEDGATDSVTHRVINFSPCPVLVVP